MFQDARLCLKLFLLRHILHLSKDAVCYPDKLKQTTAIAKVDIMDADGEVSLPVKGGKHLKEDFVGKNYLNYDFTVVLSHFKGHAMGGFGGAIKNISIGIASSGGKAWIHSAGTTKDVSKVWGNLPEQDNFLESMAEAAKASNT